MATDPRIDARRRTSLKWRLPLGVSTLIVAFIAVFLWVAFHEVKEAFLRTGSDRAQAAADQLASLTAPALHQRAAEEHRVASTEAVSEYIHRRSEESRVKAQAALDTMSGTGPQVTVVWSNSGEPLLVSARPESARAVLGLGRPPTGAALTLERIDGSIVFEELVEILADGSAPIAATARVGYLAVRRSAAGSAAGPATLTRLLGNDARILLGGESGQWTDLTSLVPPPIQGLKPSRATVVLNGHERIGAVSEISGTPWFVWVDFPVAAVVAPAMGFLREAGFIALIFVGLAFAVSYVAANTLTRPLRSLTAVAEAIASGDYSRRNVVTRSDEIGRLGIAFNTMMAQIQAAHEDRVRERTSILLETNQRLADEVQQRSRVEDALRVAEERMRFALEASGVGVWEANLKTGISYWSTTCERLHGLNAGTFGGTLEAFAERIHEKQRAGVLASIERATREHHDADLVYQTPWPDGTLHWIASTGRVSYDDAGAPVRAAGVAVDVTERRKLELELRQAQKLESVGRLAAGVAHEINTPIQFVSDSLHFIQEAFAGLASVIERYRGVTATGGLIDANTQAAMVAAEDAADVPYALEQLPKALVRAQDGLSRVAIIVRSMKEFAHPDQTQMAPVDLNRAVESTLAVARNEYKYVAELDVVLGELPRVTCFAGDVNQAVLNIVVNAAHAIEDRVKGTDQRGRIGVRTCLEGEFVTIAISDTGGGIPESIQAHIFDPFFTTKEVGRGTGQGLAIARSVIVDKHGGELTFETHAGRGTTFILRLPINGQPSGVAA